MKTILYNIIYFFYASVSIVLAPLALIFLLYKKRKDPKYGIKALQLLGFYTHRFSNSIVFHTVSVGEVIAAKPLIQEFKKRHPKLNIIVTTTTSTGAQEAQKIKDILHVYAPLDSFIAVKLFLRSFNPDVIYIMETELWPNLLRLSHKHKTKICVFNARMPQKTCDTYAKHKDLFYHLIFQYIDLVIAQTKEDQKRFTTMGVPTEQCLISGSIKYDLTPNEELFTKGRKIKQQLQYTECWGAISTHDGEEELILESFITLKSQYPNLKLILVPRHQSSTALAIKYLDERQISYQLKTNLKTDLSNFKSDILVGNTIGEIELYLGLCDLVFMGGSLIDIGGHNPLEPAYFSIPIITGPYYYNFNEQFELLIEKRGAFVAQDHRRLCNVVAKLLDDPKALQEYGVNALDVQQQGKGAIQRTLNDFEIVLRN